jgi:hypothetical protein
MTTEQVSRLETLRTIRHDSFVKAKRTEFRYGAEAWREANRTYVEYRDSVKRS